MADDIFEKFRLDDRVAIVTGGFGILGTEFVQTLRQAGAKVAIFELKEGGTIDEKIKAYKVDIAKRESIEAAVKDVVQDFGYPRILVNCAAIDFPPSAKGGGLLETKDDETLFDKVMEVNVKGMELCSQIVAQYMIEGGKGGSIINISSIYGEVSPDQRIYPKNEKGESFSKPIVYSVSKSAISGMTKYLAAYPNFAKHKIRVNMLTFGGVFNSQKPDFVDNYSAKVPLGRMARKDEYNGAVLFLASDASSYMTGANITLDGGYTAL